MTTLTITQKDNILRMLLSTANIDGVFNEKEIMLFNEIAEYLNRSGNNYANSANSIVPSTIYEDWQNSEEGEKYYVPVDPEEIAVLLILQYMMVKADGAFNELEKTFVEDFISTNFSLTPEIMPIIGKATEVTLNNDSLKEGSIYLVKAFEDYLLS